MTIGDFLLFVTATIGLTHIMVDSVVVQPLRNIIKFLSESEQWHGKRGEFFKWILQKINKMISCYQCAGFWCGLVAGGVLVSLNPLVILFCGFASSYLALQAAHFLNYLEANSVITIPKNGN
jgi:hypothetical protein